MALMKEHDDACEQSRRQPDQDSISHTSLQLDLLVRLRVIEQLQAISYPRVNVRTPDDVLIVILNWISYCLDRTAVSQCVAVAFAAERGLVTLYVSINPHLSSNNPRLSGDKSLTNSAAALVTLLRQVFDAPPDIAMRTFIQMSIKMCLPRLIRKVLLIGSNDEGPHQTAYHFSSLVSLWLVCRPQGERSKEFLNMAINFGGNVNRATEFMVQSLYTLVNQSEASLRSASPDDVYPCVLSTITACGSLVTSTFFEDLTSHAAFKLSLKVADCETFPLTE